MRLSSRLQKEERVTTLLISHDLSVAYRYASSALCGAREPSHPRAAAHGRHLRAPNRKPTARRSGSIFMTTMDVRALIARAAMAPAAGLVGCFAVMREDDSGCRCLLVRRLAKESVTLSYWA